MKRILIVIVTLLIILLSALMVSAASVTPVRHEGNDIPQSDTLTPPGCIYYTFGDNPPGIYSVRFTTEGQPDPAGPLIFTTEIGTKTGDDFTSVLIWQSNFPIYAVIVKGGNAFNFYQYPANSMSDTDLVSPLNASGIPADVSHVSLIFCPGEATPTPTPTETPIPDECICLCLIWFFIAFLSLIVGICIGIIICKCKRKNSECDFYPC